MLQHLLLERKPTLHIAGIEKKNSFEAPHIANLSEDQNHLRILTKKVYALYFNDHRCFDTVWIYH